MFQRQTTILSAAGVLMIMAIGGAALGLIKLHLLTGLLNPNSADSLDAFQFAFTIPDFVFNILIIGALNAAFIPIFGQLVHKNKTKESWHVLASMINTAALFFGVISLVVFLTADYIIPLLARDFTASQLEITIRLTKLLMISPILLGVSAFITGAIQVHHRFFIPALAPFLYNVGAIFGIIYLYPQFGVDGLAYGILIGSVMHLLLQIPMIYHLGYRHSLRLGWATNPVQRIAKLTLPRSLGVGVDRVEVVVITMLLATISSGGLFLFTKIQTLIAFPISFFGVSIAQAALPTLTKEAAENVDEFRTTLFTTFHQILYLVVPVTVLMIILKLPIIRMVGNLDDWTLTLEAAQVLLWLAPAIIAQSAIHLWARASYALEDSVLPLLAGSVGVVLTVLLSIVTLDLLGMKGIALGMVIGSFVTVALLIYFVHRRIGGFTWSSFYMPILRIGVCGAIMAVAVYWPVKPMESALFDTSKTADLILLSVVVSGFGLSLYLFISWILGSKEIVMFLKVANQLRSWREAFVRFPATYSNTPTVNEGHSTDSQV